MTESKTLVDSASLDVAVYLHIEQEAEAVRCEILAGTPDSPETFYDAARNVVVTTEFPAMTRYTLVAARDGKHNGVVAERRVMTRLAEWISVVLRSVIDGDRAAVIALPAQPGAKGLHWMIAPLREGAQSLVSASVLGMDQCVLILKEGAVDGLAGQLRRALA